MTKNKSAVLVVRRRIYPNGWIDDVPSSTARKFDGNASAYEVNNFVEAMNAKETPFWYEALYRTTTGEFIPLV